MKCVYCKIGKVSGRTKHDIDIIHLLKMRYPEENKTIEMQFTKPPEDNSSYMSSDMMTLSPEDRYMKKFGSRLKSNILNL